MNVLLPTVLQLFAAASCLGLGALVLAQNPHKTTHRAFALLAANLGLWAVGVSLIINAHNETWTLFLLRATFIIASFIPVTYQYFVGVFPTQRFDGYRWLLVLLILCAVAASIGAFTPWYVRTIRISPNLSPTVEYGPVFGILFVAVALTMLFGYPLLWQKRGRSSGVERLQIEHILLGTFAFTTLSSLTNVIAPLLGLNSLEPYGPVFVVLMMGIFAYAMVRYHLLDMWVIVSRTTVYAVTTAFVALTFLGIIPVVHWMVGGRTAGVVPTLFAALVIALVLHPIKERTQHLLERVVLKRRYNVQALLARASQRAAQIVQLDRLLRRVADDIRDTLGVTTVQVFLVDEKNPSVLRAEYSSVPGDIVGEIPAQGPLIDYVTAHPVPIALEEVLHTWPLEEHSGMAHHLAELDAYLCVPLKTTGGLVGLLTLGPKTSRDIYTSEDITAFTALAGPLATSIENARLYRRIEEANRHREQVLSSMRGGVIAVDGQGKVRTANRTALDLLGPIEVGQGIEAIPAPVAQVLRQTLETRRDVRDFETLLKGPAGDEIPVAMSSACLVAADDELAGAMVMIYDLSQVKRLEENVQRADRLSSIGTLAAGMAHEIKNPLVSIKTFAQLMPRRYDDHEFREAFSEVVLHEVDRIDSIVSSLLNFARPRPAQFAPHDIRRVIGDVLMLVTSQAEKSHVDIRSELPPRELMVFGDEQQLHQVLLNLVLNAIEAMVQTGGGHLHVSASTARMHLQRNRLAPLLDVECVKIAVQDSGPGIPEDHLDRIFTPFYTTKENGSGLGLSVVHGIVTEHRGQIDVRGGPDQGTTFIVTLPLADNAVSVGGSQ